LVLIWNFCSGVKLEVMMFLQGPFLL